MSSSSSGEGASKKRKHHEMMGSAAKMKMPVAGNLLMMNMMRVNMMRMVGAHLMHQKKKLKAEEKPAPVDMVKVTGIPLSRLQDSHVMKLCRAIMGKYKPSNYNVKKKEKTLVLTFDEEVDVDALQNTIVSYYGRAGVAVRRVNVSESNRYHLREPNSVSKIREEKATAEAAESVGKSFEEFNKPKILQRGRVKVFKCQTCDQILTAWPQWNSHVRTKKHMRLVKEHCEKVKENPSLAEAPEPQDEKSIKRRMYEDKKELEAIRLDQGWVWCDICNLEIQAHNMESHCAGKKHKKRARMKGIRVSNAKPIYGPNLNSLSTSKL